jgi:hypothetical protein
MFLVSGGGMLAINYKFSRFFDPEGKHALLRGFCEMAHVVMFFAFQILCSTFRPWFYLNLNMNALLFVVIRCFMVYFSHETQMIKTTIN